MNKWAVALFLLALCLLTYGNILNNEFMLDDHPFLRAGYSQVYGQFSEFFTKSYAHHYSPLYFVVNVSLFEHFAENRAALHLINISLFYASGLLFYFLLLNLTSDKWLALGASTLHFLHPINSFTVNYITCNFVFIAAIFMQVSLLAYWSYSKGERRRPLLFVLSLLSFVISLLTFEGALLLPAYVMLIVFFLRGETLQRSFQAALPFFVIAFIYFCFWLYMAGPQANLGDKIGRLDINAGVYAATILQLVCWYVINLILPFDVVFIKNTAPFNELVVVYLLAGLIMILGSAYLVLKVWKRDLKSMAFLWLAVGFLLVMVAGVGHADMGFVIEPHWLYFSSLGFFMLFAIYLKQLKPKMPAKIALALLLLLGGFYWVLTQAYNALERSEKTYCLYWLEKSPGNIIASLRLGELYYYEKDYARAASYLTFAADRYTNIKTKARLLHNLGHVYNEAGFEDKAFKSYQEAIRVNPEFAPPFLALGEWYLKKARWQEAELYFNKAIVLKPEDEFSVLRLAELYLLSGNRQQAVLVLEKFLQLNPQHPKASVINSEILSLKEAL